MPPRKTPKLRLSPTRIAAFMACRMLYKYEYIDKIGRFYHRARAGNSFGATLHQALQDFHTAGGAQSEDAQALGERAIAVWRSAGYADTNQEVRHQALAVEILEKYHEVASERADRTRLFLAEKMIKYDMGDFVLTGRIDRINEHLEDGALEIIDYKSGRDFVSEDDVREALAMSIYQLIAKRNWPERRVFATIHALRGGVAASAELTTEELSEWEDALRDVGRQIIETDYESLRPAYLPDTCPACDFYPRCNRYFQSRREWDD
ncbi:MAG TPA: PD-(D/E)XK nuclease family protein [Capsulimonadaceae bacterium]|nr:PD-(D/E)XK nuclease family protein [Capsulimonadaceae bacterium]